MADFAVWVENGLFLLVGALLLWIVFSMIPGTKTIWDVTAKIGNTQTLRNIFGVIALVTFVGGYWLTYRKCSADDLILGFLPKPNMDTLLLPACADKSGFRAKVSGLLGNKSAEPEVSAQREQVYAAAARAVSNALKRPISDVQSESSYASSASSSSSGGEAVNAQPNYVGAVKAMVNAQMPQ